MRWEAEYADGMVIRKGEGISYYDLNHVGLAKLRVFDGVRLVGEVEAAPDRVLFYRLRTPDVRRPNDNKAALLGWKTANQVSYTLYFVDGRIEHFSEWNNAILTAEPKWFPNERL